MTDLVPIRVKIGLLPNGYAKYPDWSLMPMVGADGNMRPFAPYGWMYDKKSGHAEVRKGGFWASQTGSQWGCLLVTEAFADAAVAQFPGIVEEITEAVFEVFYDDLVMAHVPQDNTNTALVQDLDAELRLRTELGENTTALKARITKALDPNDETEPGIIKNKNKKWADSKVNRDVKIKNRNN